MHLQDRDLIGAGALLQHANVLDWPFSAKVRLPKLSSAGSEDLE
jgi:hypothetical protein